MSKKKKNKQAKAQAVVTSPATEEGRVALLTSLGLDAKAKGLAPLPSAPQRETGKRKPMLAPEGVDPHTMPVTDIVFDEALLDDFPSLDGEGMAAASRYIFPLYKSRGRDKDRNSLLHDRIGKFIVRTRNSRVSGVPHVKEQVRQGKKQRELLAFMAEMGVTSREELLAVLGKAGE